MKYIVIGLGNFGASLAEKLTGMGNEVIGVDINMSKVEAMKEKITHAIRLDSTDVSAVAKLPLIDTDIVIVAIGEDMGANIMATALMKQMHVNRLISRAISPLQQMVLEAMGVNEIIHPEEETAERWSKKLNFLGVVDSFDLNKYFSVVETEIPQEFDGQTLDELKLKKKYNVMILTTIRISSSKNELGGKKKVSDVQEIASGNTVLHQGDLMVLYGNTRDIKKMIKDISQS